MPSPINQELITRGLVDTLGLKGRFRLIVDETAVPTFQVGDLERSPFTTTKILGAGDLQAAVVAENSYVFASPSLGTILCIDAIEVTNLGIGRFTINRLTAANLATAGAPTSITFMRDFNALEPPQANGPRLNATVNTLTFIGGLGDEIYEGRVLANTTQVIRFPNGYYLHGSDPAGINGLAVINAVVNIGITANFFCREFRLPG